ncbi:MAG: YIP1 family protein [Halobacteriales archaeon]|nr:YIP1 family protein [Halobacteriales archaeon]
MAHDRSPVGRGRGPSGLARAWVTAVRSPSRFFRAAVIPGDQAPGLLFALTVVLVEEATRLIMIPGAIPTTRLGPVPSAVIALALAVLLVAPVALHLTAALVTIGLVLLTRERATISETVQVVGYATAPCLFAGLPVPAIRVVATAYGAVMLGVGIAVVHDVSPAKAALAVVLPAGLVFGYGFRGIPALLALLPF